MQAALRARPQLPNQWVYDGGTEHVGVFSENSESHAGLLSLLSAPTRRSRTG